MTVHPDLDAAIEAISRPERLRQAQELVARVAPDLQRVLNAAISEGGWFDAAHNAAVREASALSDPEHRLKAVRTIFAEETRLSMLVGVAVGLELARELGYEWLGAPADPDHAHVDPDNPHQEV
jgi:hypothetical protein